MSKRDRILKKFKKYQSVIPTCRPGLQYLGNFKCHNNALSYALSYKDEVKRIVGGVQVFHDEAVAHFIVELKDGTYVDPTFGNLANIYEHFIIIKKYKVHSFQPKKELYKMKRKIYNNLTKDQQRKTLEETC